MTKKSLIISEDCHTKIKTLAVFRKKKISELVEEIITKEFNKDPQCNLSTNI